MWDIHALAFIVSSLVLAVWARKQYSLQSGGYFLGQAFVIFPVHMQLLLALGATSLAQGLMITVLSVVVGEDGSRSDKMINLLGNSVISFGLSHAVIGKQAMNSSVVALWLPVA